MEDKNGEPHIRNLSILPVSTEEDAMRLLFLGETNRAIAETPMNEYSSRSHCIFTVYVNCRQSNQKMKISKLNLVDLAGSERVYKSQITGTVLNEAKHINLSLHFLQQVILALSESRRIHIPYRNSIMTFILKDSLVGNCITIMLATLAVDNKNIQESISTCRFAQRVALIKTEPVINEVIDPYQEILLLRNEIKNLEEQLAIRNTKPSTHAIIKKHNDRLTEQQKFRCESIVDDFINNTSNSSLQIEPEMSQIQYCFALMKNQILSLKADTRRGRMEQCNLQACISQEWTLQNNDLQLPENFEPINEAPVKISAAQILEKNKWAEKSIEADHFVQLLNLAYQKASILAATIEECQKNIKYLRTKLDHLRPQEIQQKRLLVDDLEYQQNIYKRSIVQLGELKTETTYLECNIKRIEAINVQSKKSNVHLNQTNSSYTCENHLPTVLARDKCEHIARMSGNCREVNEALNHETLSSSRCCNINQNRTSTDPSNSLSVNSFLSYGNDDSFKWSNDMCLCNYDASRYKNFENCQRVKSECCSCLECCNTIKCTCSCDYSALKLQNQAKIRWDGDMHVVEHCDVPIRQQKGDHEKEMNPQTYVTVSQIAEPFSEHNSALVKGKTKHGAFNNPTRYGLNGRGTRDNFLKDTDAEEFKTFVQNIPLSGDPQVDTEIIQFYRNRFR